MTNDCVHQYTWDAEHKMHSVDASPASCSTSGQCLTYDAMGRMVEKVSGSTVMQIVYGPQGRFATMNGQTLLKAFIPLPTGATAVYTSSGLAYYRHVDHLGSARLATTPSRTPYGALSYSPYGETYSQSGSTDLDFAGQERYTVTGMFDATMRKFTTAQGRWLSPDPAGLGATDATSPQSWNRYAYVVNSPMSMVDPLGEDGCDPQGAGGNCNNGSSCTGWCPGQMGGMVWVDPVDATAILNGEELSYRASLPGYTMRGGKLYLVLNHTTKFISYIWGSQPGSGQEDDIIPITTFQVNVNWFEVTMPSSAANNGFTFQVGVAINWNFWGPLAGSGFAGFAIDRGGHVAAYWGGGGGMAAGAGVSGGVQFAGSNGNSVCALGGPFTNVSGTAGYELAGTGDYFQGAGDAPGGLVQGGGVTLGVGGGGAASLQVTGTSVHPFGHSCVNGKIQ